MIRRLLSQPEGWVLAGLVVMMAILAAVFVGLIEMMTYEGDEEFDVD